MDDSDDMFVREDISKPENRVNLALFSLMQQDWFREWLLERLGMPTNAIVYPPENVRGRHPDLKVSRGGSTLAWIEVELGTNAGQAQDYREQFDQPVKTIWGRRCTASDLSLEEVADFLCGKEDLPPQAAKNVEHLHKLIRIGLDGHSSSSERVEVSDEMWNDPLVVALRDRLGGRMERTTVRVGIGHLKADTVGKEGFSLKVNRGDTSGEVALISISAGARLIFPSRKKLGRCLPRHRAEVNDYMSLISWLGCDVDVEGDNASPHLPLDRNLDRVLHRIDDLARSLGALAGRPSS